MIARYKQILPTDISTMFLVEIRNFQQSPPCGKHGGSSIASRLCRSRSFDAAHLVNSQVTSRTLLSGGWSPELNQRESPYPLAPSPLISQPWPRTPTPRPPDGMGFLLERHASGLPFMVWDVGCRPETNHLTRGCTSPRGPPTK